MKKFLSLPLLFILLSCFQLPSFSQGLFLKIDGLFTDNVIGPRAGEFRVRGYSMGAANPFTSSFAVTGIGTGKVSFEPFTVSRQPDPSLTPLLFGGLTSNKRYATAELRLYILEGGREQLSTVVKLTGVYITRVSHITGENGEVSETIGLSFGQVEWIGYPIAPRGGIPKIISAGYNLRSDAPVTPGQ